MNACDGLKTQSVPALERGLLNLELLAQSRRGVTLSQLTRKLQLSRSTVHALLLTYQRCGYIQREKESGRYCLGWRLFTLANMALCRNCLREQFSSILYRLMLDSGLTVHFAVMVEGEVILIDRIQPPREPKLASWVGKRMGIHCTALGKALIAHLPAPELDELIAKHGLCRYNENTIASPRKLREACEQVRRLGYALDDEEEEIGTRCVGAPVYNADGEVAAAISISGTKAELEDIPGKAALVVHAAASLSKHIGSVWNKSIASVPGEETQDMVA